MFYFGMYKTKTAAAANWGKQIPKAAGLRHPGTTKENFLGDVKWGRQRRSISK